MDLQEMELSVKGWNWGAAKFKGMYQQSGNYSDPWANKHAYTQKALFLINETKQMSAPLINWTIKRNSHNWNQFPPWNFTMIL